MASLIALDQDSQELMKRTAGVAQRKRSRDFERKSSAPTSTETAAAVNAALKNFVTELQQPESSQDAVPSSPMDKLLPRKPDPPQCSEFSSSSSNYDGDDEGNTNQVLGDPEDRNQDIREDTMDQGLYHAGLEDFAFPEPQAGEGTEPPQSRSRLSSSSHVRAKLPPYECGAPKVQQQLETIAGGHTPSNSDVSAHGAQVAQACAPTHHRFSSTETPGLGLGFASIRSSLLGSDDHNEEAEIGTAVPMAMESCKSKLIDIPRRASAPDHLPKLQHDPLEQLISNELSSRCSMESVPAQVDAATKSAVMRHVEKLPLGRPRSYPGKGKGHAE